MREELNRNDEIVYSHQNSKIKQNRPNAERHKVSAAAVVMWLLLALVALSLWLMRLLGTISLPV